MNGIFKKLAALIVCGAVVLSAQMVGSLTVHAQQIGVTVDGARVNFPDAQPVIINGRTLVPMRGVFEQMGFVGDWNPQTQTSTLMRAGMNIAVRSGDEFFTVNGVQNFPEVPPQLLGGRFMIPLRAVAESTGANVSWNENTRTVIITTGRATQTPAPTPTPTPTPTPAPTRNISIANQVGQMAAGIAGTVDFPVITQNIPNGSYQLALRGNLPNGIALQSSNLVINNNSGTLRLSGNTSTVPGTFVITVGINLGANGGWVDENLTLNITAPQMQVADISIGAMQGGPITQGSGLATVTFPVATRGFVNANYNVTLINPPAGVRLIAPTANAVAITSNTGTLSLEVDRTQVPLGNITLTFDFEVSPGAWLRRTATFTVGGAPAPTITGGTQVPSPIASGTGMQQVVFTFNVQNTTDGDKATNDLTNFPGVNHVGFFNVNNNIGTLVLSVNTNVLAPGTHSINFSALLTDATGDPSTDRWVPFTITVIVN